MFSIQSQLMLTIFRGHELEHFASYSDFRVSEHSCDVIFDKPTVLIKLDASVNMYHHFCDFINLYASQHINGSIDMDIDILWWDTVNFVIPLIVFPNYSSSL